MGDTFPRYPDEVAGGDEPTYPPKNSLDHSLLAAERGTQQTHRLETDANNNLYVNVAEGSIDVTVGEVEIKNDVGNPVPVSDAGGSLTVDGTIAVSNFPASVEVSNDAGNPLPVSGTVTANAGMGPFPVSDNGGSLTVDGPLTNTELRASAVPISAASLPLPSGAATESTLSGVKSDLDKVVGTWAYYAGTSGTVNVTSGQRVLGISAHSTLGGTMTINGGQTITVPANVSLVITPVGNLTAPTIVFTSTDTYFIEVVS